MSESGRGICGPDTPGPLRLSAAGGPGATQLEQHQASAPRCQRAWGPGDWAWGMDSEVC